MFKLGHCGYDELLRVPFLMRCPGVIPPGMTTNAMASSIDVLPTLLEMMGLPKPEGIDGLSFAHLFRDPAATHREQLVCASMDNNLTLTTDRWKFVLNYNPRDLDELYDLKADPGEMVNLAADPAHEKTVQEMRGRLLSWLDETGRPYADTIARKAAVLPAASLDLRPAVTDFHWDGENAIEYRYTWHVNAALPTDEEYWSFTHFMHPTYGKDGEIVFRDTTWPPAPPRPNGSRARNIRSAQFASRSPNTPVPEPTRSPSASTTRTSAVPPATFPAGKATASSLAPSLSRKMAKQSQRPPSKVRPSPVLSMPAYFARVSSRAGSRNGFFGGIRLFLRFRRGKGCVLRL